MALAMVERGWDGGQTGVMVLAVLVLYGMRAEDSPAYRSLLRLREDDAEVARSLNLLLWDNSPEQRLRPASLEGTYHQDSGNPGLAAAYSRGLEEAERMDIPWLLLLDQDTVVTAEYLRDVLLRCTSAGTEVSAMVPRLTQGARVVSPLLPRQLGPPAVYAGPAGVFKANDRSAMLQAFNSGAVLRVAALRAVGGFDARFPLDYLDHATFAALQRVSGRVLVLESAIEHSLSTNTGVASTRGQRFRQGSILAAERRFYLLYGGRLERWLYPVRLLRRAASEMVKKRDLASALQILRHLF